MSIRTLLELLGASIVLVGVVWWTVHERDVGEARVQAADTAASARLQQATDAKTESLQQAATKSAQEAANARNELDHYVAAHPVGVVRLCNTTNGGGSGLSQARPTPSVQPGPGSGSGSLPAVPASAPGPDIGPGLALLVSAASELAVEREELRERALSDRAAAAP